MDRIFTVLAALSVMIILLVGGGVCWLSSAQIQQAKQQASQATAEGVAARLSTQITALQQHINVLAQSPAVVAALSTRDPVKLAQTAAQLEYYIPGALSVRLLLPGTQSLDTPATLGMGFADLALVSESFINQQQPAIHEQGAKQHLAFTAKTSKNNIAIGVLFVSVNISPITQILQSTVMNEGYLRLMQGTLALQERGDATLKSAIDRHITVSRTPWQVEYATTPAMDTTQQSMFVALIVAAALFATLIFFRAYHYFEALFIKDRSTVLNATKDLVNRRLHDNYSVNFNEMRFMIDMLTGYNQTATQTPHAPDQSPYQFSDEVEGIDFFDTPDATQPAQAAAGSETKPESATSSLLEAAARLQHKGVDSIFQTYAIRGIVNKNLTADVMFELGKAFGSELTLLSIKTVVLGYDGRLSSEAFAEAFARGVIATGTHVKDIGRVPTPLLCFATHQQQDLTGAMITGSHYSTDHNGLKLIVKGEPITEACLLAIKKRIAGVDYCLASPGNIEKISRYSKDYVNKLTKDISLINALKVVVDCGNGVTGILGPALLKSLGCEVIELFSDIDGHFPNHHPDPSQSENMGDLVAAVLHYEADVGIAFDGSGDRLGIVDSKGKIISPDHYLMLLAKHALQAKPGAHVIFDVKCSKQLGDQITQYGGKPFPCKGDSTIMHTTLKQTHAVLAGEMNGRVYFNDRWLGYEDALYAAARMLELLSADLNDSNTVFKALTNPTKKSELSSELLEG